MNARLDVLLLEDTREDAALIESALAKGGFDAAVRRVETRDEFVDALRQARPDVVLADFSLPEFNGISALKLAQEHAAGTPVIIVTRVLPDEVAVTMLREGAVDYLLKDRLSRLAPAVRRAVEAKQSEQARRDSEERYRALFAEARDGIVLVDVATGVIEDCNPEFERQCGRTRDALRSLPLWGLCAPDAGTSAHRQFVGIFESGAGGDSRHALRRPDGIDVHVEFRTRPIELRGRSYALAVSRDITERLKIEWERSAQLDELRRFQRVSVDRELRMEEIEGELRRLKSLPVNGA